MNLKKLNSQVIEVAIQNIINSGNRSITLTLVGGDILFGDLYYLPYHFTGTPEEATKNGLWIPESLRSLSPISRYAYKIRPVCLVFNSKDGTKYGRSHHIVVKDEFISGIRPLFWTEESLASLTLKNIPNPFASLICTHNYKVAVKYGLHISDIIECALATSGIPPEGINFSQDEIIYADWEFFSNISRSSLSIGAYGASVSIGRSLYQIAYDKITNGIIEKITKFLPSSRSIRDRRLQGFLVVPQPEITTFIEGYESVVVICSDQRSFPPKSKFMPVILKKKSISYPIEFLPFLKSRLVFYGKIKQVPIKINGLHSNYMLIARAIGYVATH